MEKRILKSLESAAANLVETAEAMEGEALDLLRHNRKLKDERLLKSVAHLKAAVISMRRAAGFVDKVMVVGGVT